MSAKRAGGAAGGDPEPRVALVTGGSRGIGRAVVEALLERGWRVFFCSLRPESVDRAAAELEARFPGRVAGRAADVRRQDEVEALVTWVESQAGRLDCLVNNAGVGDFAAVDELDGESWRRTLETNLSGAFYALHAAARSMKNRGEGWVINIASLAAAHPFAGGAAYNASKFGLVGLSEAAMLDLRPHGVRVAAVLPGSVATEFGGGSDGADWKLQPADVARAVIDLLAYRRGALPSRVELRPTSPPRK